MTKYLCTHPSSFLTSYFDLFDDQQVHFNIVSDKFWPCLNTMIDRKQLLFLKTFVCLNVFQYSANIYDHLNQKPIKCLCSSDIYQENSIYMFILSLTVV